MLTQEKFASLLLIGTPLTYGSPAVVPPEHSARLIALGYMADIQGRLRNFLSSAPSVEALLREHLGGWHARFDHLDRDMRMIAETVALHARYHLTVVPPLTESQQREAILLGDERFKVPAADSE